MRKTCGKPVHGARNTWARVQFVYTKLRNKMYFLASKTTRFPRFPHEPSPAFPTRNLFKITGVTRGFSPLSTALIITTTT